MNKISRVIKVSCLVKLLEAKLEQARMELEAMVENTKKRRHSAATIRKMRAAARRRYRQGRGNLNKDEILNR